VAQNGHDGLACACTGWKACATSPEKTGATHWGPPLKKNQKLKTENRKPKTRFYAA
jgi:hypothetical protein